MQEVHRREELAQALAEERDLMELVFTLFRDTLQLSSSDASGTGKSDAASVAAWRAFTLANLKAFARRCAAHLRSKQR